MFVVQGATPLSGRVRVDGAKNAALPIMAACLAVDGRTTLHDVPALVDVTTLANLLRALGLESSRRADGALELEVVDEQQCVAEYDLVRRMRASFCVLGPLLAKRGRACVSLPGGCNIGNRPIDLHLKGLEALGADVRIERGYVIAEAKRLRGQSIYLGGPYGSTVTGTCNVMSAAVFAEGVTRIEAAACEPEVIDLGQFLNRMGAKITGLGTPFIEIEGVDALQAVEHTIIPDRIEAITLIVAAAITRGNVKIDNVPTDHMTSVFEKLREIGVGIEIQDGSVSVSVPDRLRPADCIAQPHPGIPTDVQAQLTSLLATIEGISVVTDRVFPDRFLHAPELVRLGAKIRREGASAIVEGVSRLNGACVMASDLRASAALVLAALAAEGESVVRRIYHLDRGYANLEVKLGQLGADIARLVDCPKNMPSRLRPEAIGHEDPKLYTPSDDQDAEAA